MNKLLSESPSVCVAIAAYNVGDYIERTIISVLNQTYHNIKVLVINDGSTDNTLSILNRFENRITLINQANQGLSSVRNKAIEVCDTDYLVQIDGDDYVEKDWIKDCVRKMSSQKLDLLFFGYDSVSENGKYLKHGIRKEYTGQTVLTKNEVIYQIATNQMNNYAWSYILKSCIAKKIRQPVFPIGLKFEDMATTYKFVLNANKIGFLDRIYYHYVQRKNSITKSPSKKEANDLLKIKRILNQNINKIVDKNTISVWNLNIDIARYQILSYSIKENLKELKKLREKICLENRAGLPKVMNVKIQLIKYGIYKYLYPLSAYLRWKI